MKTKMLPVLTLCIFLSQTSPAVMASALQCPDPNESSLKFGEIPPPWKENPFSPYPHQKYQDAHFMHVKLITSKEVESGVVCLYRNSWGEYSIWRPGQSKPDSQRFWFKTDDNYFCAQSLTQCQFYID